MRRAHPQWLLLLVFAISLPATAAELLPEGISGQTTLSQRLSFDSNPLRVNMGEQSLVGSVTEPTLTIRSVTPLSKIESETRVVANVYDDSDYDSVDLYQKLNLSRSNERWTASVNGTLDYDTTRVSELTNYSLNLPKIRSTKLGATPTIAFRPNVDDTVSLSASMLGATYDNNAFTDYNVYSMTPSYARRFDPDNSGIFSVRAQRYETDDDSDLTSDSYGASIGWTTVLTPRLTAMANGGVQYNEKTGTNAGGDPESWNYIFAGKLAYRGIQDTFDASASRALEPFGNGTETLLTSFTLNERHAVNESLVLTGTATYQFADYDAQPGINLDRGITAGAGVNYKLYEALALTADYRYRNEELTNIAGDIDQHIVLVGFNLTPESTRW